MSRKEGFSHKAGGLSCFCQPKQVAVLLISLAAFVKMIKPATRWWNRVVGGVKSCADAINVSGSKHVSISSYIRRLESALGAKDADAHSLFIKPPGRVSEHPACSGVVPSRTLYVRSEGGNLLRGGPLIPPPGGAVAGASGQHHLCEQS